MLRTSQYAPNPGIIHCPGDTRIGLKAGRGYCLKEINESLLVIGRVHDPSQGKLLLIVEAGRSSGFEFGPG